MGLMSPIFAALIAPSSELWSHGCATAVITGSRVFAVATRRWYFWCVCSLEEFVFCVVLTAFSFAIQNSARDRHWSKRCNDVFH